MAHASYKAVKTKFARNTATQFRSLLRGIGSFYQTWSLVTLVHYMFSLKDNAGVSTKLNVGVNDNALSSIE